MIITSTVDIRVEIDLAPSERFDVVADYGTAETVQVWRLAAVYSGGNDLDRLAISGGFGYRRREDGSVGRQVRHLHGDLGSAVPAEVRTAIRQEVQRRIASLTGVNQTKFKCQAKIWHGPGHQSGTRCEITTPHPLDGDHWAADPMSPGFEWTGEKAFAEVTW